MTGHSVLYNEVSKRSAKRLTGKKKVRYVMGEFNAGDLKSSSGQKVTDNKQAIAIALHEAGLSKKRS